MGNRWLALSVLCLSVFQFTLNWFCVVPTFPFVARELGLSIPEVAGLVAAFVGGYGLFHLPGGWLSARIGMRTTLLIGILIEALASIAAALVPSYPAMIVMRLIAGAGGACCLGASVGLVSVWFRERELSLAMGLTTGVAFAFGAASGLFIWSLVVAMLGWRGALIAAGGVGLIVFVVALIAPLTPRTVANAAAGGHLNWHAVRRVFGHKALWWWGMSIVGSYGAFFTTAQFLPIYAERVLGLTAIEGGRVSAALLLSGIPAAMLGGWIADHFGRVRLLICCAFIISGAVTMAIPTFDGTTIQLAAIAVGLITMAGLTPWFSVPAMYPDSIAPHDVPAASGLMLTLAAIGGFAVPLCFGRIVASAGFHSGWLFLGGVSIAFTVFGFVAPAPELRVSMSLEARTEAP